MMSSTHYGLSDGCVASWTFDFITDDDLGPMFVNIGNISCLLSMVSVCK